MRFVHLRYFRVCDLSKTNPLGVSNMGGVTIAYDDNKWTYAICREDENFCRKTGRQTCMDRFAVNEYWEIPEGLELKDMIHRVYAHMEHAAWFGRVRSFLGLPEFGKLKHHLY